jgi:hypothetical protein
VSVASEDPTNVGSAAGRPNSPAVELGSEDTRERAAAWLYERRAKDCGLVPDWGLCPPELQPAYREEAGELLAVVSPSPVDTERRRPVTKEEVSAAMSIVTVGGEKRAECGLCTWVGPLRRVGVSASEDGQEHECFAYTQSPAAPPVGVDEAREKAKDTLEGVAEFLERVTGWSGSDPDEADEQTQAVDDALAALNALPSSAAPGATEADEAMKAILGAESGAGRLSGPRGIAECAVDRAVIYLHRRGLLTDEKRMELERRGSLGDGARAALTVSPAPSTREWRAEDGEPITRAFHEAYERLAPTFGYRTREESAVPWEDVPSKNKGLMRATIATLLCDGVIVPGVSPAPTEGQGFACDQDGTPLLPPYDWKGECEICGAPPGYPCNAEQEGRFRAIAHAERVAAAPSEGLGDGD